MRLQNNGEDIDLLNEKTVSLFNGDSISFSFLTDNCPSIIHSRDISEKRNKKSDVLSVWNAVS